VILIKTKLRSFLRAACHSFGGAVGVGAVLLMACSAQAQNLFEAGIDSSFIYVFTPSGVKSTFASGVVLDYPIALAFNSAGDLFVATFIGNKIVEITPDGVQSIFGFGLSHPCGLAFNSAGDLFEADYGSGNIYEFTPGGVKSTFAFGLSHPCGLAFNSAGDLFEADNGSGNIYEFTPGGVKSTFASGLDGPCGLAFNSAGDLFVANYFGQDIIKITPGGVQSPFASGLPDTEALAFQPAPILTIISSGANVILAWPTNAIGFTLYSTTNLVSPTLWNAVSPAPVVINGQNVVTNPISGAQEFYRLSQ
jgi:hypothetical protein